MNITKIHSVICSSEYILVIFYTESSGCQFRVMHKSGAVFGKSQTYHTIVAAERAGRECFG